MAYLFYDPLFAAPGGRCAEIEPSAALSPIEARVVELALADAPSSLKTARWRRSIATLLGLRPARPLASPRLEALRRFVVLTRHAGQATADEAARLLGFGFTREQLCAVQNRLTAI